MKEVLEADGKASFSYWLRNNLWYISRKFTKRQTRAQKCQHDPVHIFGKGETVLWGCWKLWLPIQQGRSVTEWSSGHLVVQLSRCCDLTLWLANKYSVTCVCCCTSWGLSLNMWDKSIPLAWLLSPPVYHRYFTCFTWLAAMTCCITSTWFTQYNVFIIVKTEIFP